MKKWRKNLHRGTREFRIRLFLEMREPHMGDFASSSQPEELAWCLYGLIPATTVAQHFFDLILLLPDLCGTFVGSDKGR